MRNLLILLGLCPLLAQATNYYVSSSTGNDMTGTGSMAAPWKTIVKVNAHGLAAGDSVFLKSGDVFNEPLNLDFSGHSNAHIVYSTYGGAARAIINGLYTLSGGTQIGSTKVYEFYCPGLTSKTNMLVMDGIMQPMGRWPDAGYRTYQSITSTTITDNTLPASPNWTGAYLVAHTEFYIIDTALITNQTSGGVVTVDDTLSATNIARGNGYFVENDPRTLQMPTVTTGRWYNNYTKDSIEVYLPTGPGTHTLQVPILDSLCWFNFRAYDDVYNMDFEGSNLYTVLTNHDTALTMTNCLFKYGAGNCFQFNECPGTQLVNDTLNFFQNNGALITGSTSLHCLVRNVLVNHCGLLPGMGQRSGGNGNASYTGWDWTFGYNTFQGMTILNSGYTGFCFGGDSLTINDCVVDTFCVTKVDGGGFYTNDRSFMSYTYGRKLTNCLALYGQKITSGVPFDSTDASFGFYLDSHSQQVRVSGCTGAYNTSGGLFIHGSKDTSYGNNYYGNGWAQRVVAEASGVPVTGLILKKDQFSTTASGQVLSAFITPGTDLDNFGTVDSNYFAKTDTMAFYYKYSTFAAQKVSFPTWQRLTGYDAHSSFVSMPTTFVYNTGAAAAAETFPMSNLAGSGFNGSVTVPAYGSSILYLLTP